MPWQPRCEGSRDGLAAAANGSAGRLSTEIVEKDAPLVRVGLEFRKLSVDDDLASRVSTPL
jgi:hypothetical protein